MIPRGGYRVDDMVDETAGAIDADADWPTNPSAEGFRTTEVRESRGVYLIN